VLTKPVSLTELQNVLLRFLPLPKEKLKMH
jgi:hypothetical protein